MLSRMFSIILKNLGKYRNRRLNDTCNSGVRIKNRERERVCANTDQKGQAQRRDDVLAGEWTRIGFTNLPVGPPSPETVEQLRKMVASRRLSAAPLPWPYETHPRNTSLCYPRRSCYPAARAPVPFAKRGYSPPSLSFSFSLSFSLAPFILSSDPFPLSCCSSFSSPFSFLSFSPPSPFPLAPLPLTLYPTSSSTISPLSLFRSFSVTLIAILPFLLFHRKFWDSTFAQDSSQSVTPSLPCASMPLNFLL